MTRPIEEDILYLYISISPSALGDVLVKEEAGQHRSIYFVSHTLNDAETRYPTIEKAAYAIIIAARKPRPYFDANQVVILTNLPLEKAMEKLDKSGWIIQWALELTSFGIKFQPRPTIKAQDLADFLSECSCPEVLEPVGEPWHIMTNGAANVNG